MGVENEEAHSPDASETDEHAVVDGAADEETESSTASQEEGDTPDLLSVVRDAVSDAADDESDEPDSPTGQEDDDSDSDDEQEESSEQDAAGPDDENFSDVPFSKHPRFKELLRQRRVFKEGHEQFSKLQDYLRENGLTANDAADALHISSMMKRDPEQAWAVLQPVVRDLLVKTGRVLPDDLKQRVQQGEMTQQAAMELSRARAGQSVQTQTQEHARQTAQANQRHQASQAMQQAAATWEQSMGRKDADFGAKAEDLQKEVLWLQRRDGMPQDANGVRKMLDEAYASVNRRFAKAREKKPAKKPVVGGGASNGNAPPKPKSVLDIVQQHSAGG